MLTHLFSTFSKKRIACPQFLLVKSIYCNWWCLMTSSRIPVCITPLSLEKRNLPNHQRSVSNVSSEDSARKCSSALKQLCLLGNHGHFTANVPLIVTNQKEKHSHHQNAKILWFTCSCCPRDDPTRDHRPRERTSSFSSDRCSTWSFGWG